MEELIFRIEDICMEFVNTLQYKLTWKWDGRFGAVLATCQIKNTDHIQLALKRHLESIWDNSNTEDAPEIVLDAVSRFGGLMPGQLLFTSDLGRDCLLCCAWWPWGDGETVSIRVAPYIKTISDGNKAELNRKLKDWFGISSG